MDDILRRADQVLSDNFAIRADVRTVLLAARLETARIRGVIMELRAERAVSGSVQMEAQRIADAE
jgi:hypothetical protein